MTNIHRQHNITDVRHGLGTTMLLFLSRGNRKAVFIAAVCMIAAIAVIDSRASTDLPLGFLYLFPMIFVGSVFNRIPMCFFALACTFLTEIFDDYDWNLATGVARDILYFAAYCGVGLFVQEFIRSREAALAHLRIIEEEGLAKRAAEEQLNILIESSPAAVFTADAAGTILLANDAADRLFRLNAGELRGQSVTKYLPSLLNVDVGASDQQSLRTVMECRGWRADGEVFLADVWFSTYPTSIGPRLAAMVIDVSDNLRNHEELSLQQVLASSRILVGAVSHEVRNVSGAIAVVHQNLARTGILSENKDFEALGTLILTLERIASLDFREAAASATAINLVSLLHELRIIIEPALQDEEIATEWEIKPELPMVWADRQSLIQVFLNLVKNSTRAMSKSPERLLTITTHRENDRIVVRVKDTGYGVSKPERLFQPFQPEAENTGLGLYLSRAFMRSFQGDLRYEAETKGASFIVELMPAHSEAHKGNREPTDKNSTD